MTQVFISYAREDFMLAESIAAKVQLAGYSVFYDRERITPGQDPDSAIEEAIHQCVLFIFLATSNSIAAGRYALTELVIAKERWPAITANVLGVIVDTTIERAAPPYLTAAAAPLRPQGDVATEVRREALRRLRMLGVQPVRRAAEATQPRPVKGTESAATAPGSRRSTVLTPAHREAFARASGLGVTPSCSTSVATGNLLSASEVHILNLLATTTLEAGRPVRLRSLFRVHPDNQALLERLVHAALLRCYDSGDETDYCLLQRSAFAHVDARHRTTVNAGIATLAATLREHQRFSRDRLWPLEAMARKLGTHQDRTGILLLYAQQYLDGASPLGFSEGLPTQVKLSDQILASESLGPYVIEPDGQHR